MKLRNLFIVFLIMLMGIGLFARQSVTFLKDGNKITGTIIDMSSRTGQIEYKNNQKVHRSRVWMINFANANWDFPNERSKLSNKTDSIFLRDGGVIHDKIVDFSSRRLVWEFLNTRAIHESQIKRIYFCCTRRPPAYNKPKPSSGDKKRYSITFLLSGKSVEMPLSYLNSRKTGFTDGLQINTHDIWMINFENKTWNYPAEQRRLNKQQDTIFLKNGDVVYDSIIDFNLSRKSFNLTNGGPINESRIKRIYFCCTTLPPAYKGIKFRKIR